MEGGTFTTEAQSEGNARLRHLVGRTNHRALQRFSQGERLLEIGQHAVVVAFNEISLDFRVPT